MRHATRAKGSRRHPTAPPPQVRRVSDSDLRRKSRRHRLVHEAELRYPGELARVTRQLEERVETGALPRPEAVAQLLEVAGEKARRVAVAVARLVGQLLGLGARQANRGDEGV